MNKWEKAVFTNYSDDCNNEWTAPIKEQLSKIEVSYLTGLVLFNYKTHSGDLIVPLCIEDHMILDMDKSEELIEEFTEDDFSTYLNNFLFSNGIDTEDDVYFMCVDSNFIDKKELEIITKGVNDKYAK